MANVDQLELSGKLLSTVLERVYQHTGITMNNGKRLLLQGRLRRRLRALGLDSFEAYLEVLDRCRPRDSELNAFIDAVTTHKTSFFRTPKIWQHFYSSFLPEWSAHSTRGEIRIWSAAASSGEEPYSIAMLCEEHRRRNPKFFWRLRATDISSEMVAHCAEGKYPEAMVRDAPTVGNFSIAGYFRFNDGTAQVIQELRSRITFTQHNVFEPMRGMRFDAIFLRNLLIYFSPADKDLSVRTVISKLIPGGLLVVGESESLLAFNQEVDYVAPSVYRLKS